MEEKEATAATGTESGGSAPDRAPAAEGKKEPATPPPSDREPTPPLRTPGKILPLHLRYKKQLVTYIIRNEAARPVAYVGSTSDMQRRLREHNHGSKFSYTKGKGPWSVVCIAHGFKSVAVCRAFERSVKDGGGGLERKKGVMRRLAAEFSSPETPIAVEELAEEDAGSSSQGSGEGG
eukprot:tig00000042_g15676.t1